MKTYNILFQIFIYNISLNFNVLAQRVVNLIVLFLYMIELFGFVCIGGDIWYQTRGICSCCNSFLWWSGLHDTCSIVG